jgi:hypothetical protein
LKKASPAITRFVPGREGLGLTDRIDSVVSFMKQKNILVFDQNYGLWYDRRRDDHERIRRRDGDVWGPFYAQLNTAVETENDATEPLKNDILQELKAALEFSNVSKINVLLEQLASHEALRDHEAFKTLLLACKNFDFDTALENVERLSEDMKNG